MVGEKTGQKGCGNPLPLLLGVTLPLYVIDQLTKFWVVRNFPLTEYREIPVIPGFFNLIRVHNQGVAWGFGNNTNWAPYVFLIVPIIAFSLLVIGWRTGFFAGVIGKLAAALLLSGVLGNYTDRLVQGSYLPGMDSAPLWERIKAGYVVDFLDFTIPLVHYRWPTFNVADSCVCVAATLLFISSWRQDLAAKSKPSGKA
jgi:signal peptidase II